MIRLENIDKKYISADRSVHVINNVSHEIPEGSFFTLLGPSGCGKTTTLRVISGLEKYDSGRVWFGSHLISDPEKGIFLPTSKRDIGMVFQSYAIWPHMNVYENVAYPLKIKNKSLSKEEINTKVKNILDLVGLSALINSRSTALSGGQQQRVALARALVAEPEVLLLDEPLSNLDALLREKMRSELMLLQRKIKVTSIYVTHDRAEALSMSDYIAVMNAGKIEMVGTPKEVYECPKTEFVAEFLGQCNYIEGKVREIDGQSKVIVETNFGVIKVRMPETPSLNDKVRILVRPGDLVVKNDTNDIGLSIPIRFQNVMYFGEHIEADAISNDLNLRYKSNKFDAEENKNCILSLRSNENWAFNMGVRHAS